MFSSISQPSVIPASAKWAFTTRRVCRTDVAGLDAGVEFAMAGDLVLCEIIEVGHHKRIQLASQRPAISYVGDEVVVCVGDRYAPDQFQGRAEISLQHADLLAGGGIVGTMEKAHASTGKPTQLRPIGLLTDKGGEVINITRYAMHAARIPSHVTVIGVFGSSMNSGKTTAAVSLAHGLLRAGHAVAGVKATGTGAFGDFNAFEDAGIAVSDFTDAGMPSTYRMPLDRISQGFETLVGHAAEKGADIVVVEIADGVFQEETAAILKGSSILDRMDGVLFAAPDALSSVGGVELLRRYGRKPMAVSGKVTCSPLAAMEAVTTTGVPHLTRSELCAPEQVMKVVARVIRPFAQNTASAA